MKHITILTGAGISAESGIQTFRDADGLWENHNVQDVASPEGFQRDPEMVLRFYNERRQQMLKVKPNAAHFALAELEQAYKVTIVTQNIDDLHERGGSSSIIHLHGELLKSRSVKSDKRNFDCLTDIKLGDKAPDGGQFRADIVWFGEPVPKIMAAAFAVQIADIILVIGSSMQVYPAAGLVGYAKANTPVIYIDPKPAVNYEMKTNKNLRIVAEKATTGVRKIVNELLEVI
ncbi:MAG: NAD-dependent deacylase [Saprospiraceae bacterium]|nr:NAD-dependent deacylase [Saprospiraceae bacterium]